MRTNSSTKTARTSNNHSPRTGLVETVVINGAEGIAEVAEEASQTAIKAPATKGSKTSKKAVTEPAKAKTSRQITAEKLAPLGAFTIANHYSRQTWTVKDAEGKGWLFNRETLALIEDTKENRTQVLG